MDLRNMQTKFHFHAYILTDLPTDLRTQSLIERRLA